MLHDGTVVSFRPISPDDVGALKRFHRRLSRRSVYLRGFAGSLRELPDRKAGRLTHLDDGFALVALDPERTDEIIAVVLYVRESGADRAELAALVEDRWQGKGLGLGLMRALIEVARREGIEGLWGVVLPENTRMLSLLRNLELPKRTYLKNGLVYVELNLRPEG